MAVCAEEEEAGGEDGDLAGPPPPGPGDALDEEEDGDLLGPTPPPAKKRKVHAADANTRVNDIKPVLLEYIHSGSNVQTGALHSDVYGLFTMLEQRLCLCTRC